VNTAQYLRMMRALLILACLLGISQALVRVKSADHVVGEAGVRSVLGDPASDAYIDQVLDNLRQVIAEQGLDPASLPDLETGFSDTVLGITWHGTAWLRNGQLWGLSSISRTGETSLTVDENSGTVELTAMLSLSNLQGHYDAHADFMGIGVNAGATLHVQDIQIYADATAAISAEGSVTLQLQNFYINHLGSIDVDISGLGPLDWILGLLVDLVDTFFRDWIKDLVEGPLRDLLQNLLNDIHFDIPGYLLNMVKF